MKCKMCPKQISKWRMEQWPHIRTCSQRCSMDNAAQNRKEARKRAGRPGAARNRSNSLPARKAGVSWKHGAVPVRRG